MRIFFWVWKFLDLWVLVMENFLDMWFWSWEFFRTCSFGHGNFFGMIWVMGIDELNFYVVEPQESRGSPSAWAALFPSIKNVINVVGFGTFFKALSNQDIFLPF